MNPFISFCLYVAARIYTHAYKKRPNDESVRSNLDFLLITMQAHRKKNPITESFLVQLMVELDAAGLDHHLYQRDPTIRKPIDELFKEGEKCPPVFQSPSKTQPTFHELRQRESLSPVTSNLSNAASHSSGSRFQSPQPQYQSSFAVSNRQSVPSNPAVVPSQGWGDQGFIGPANHRSVFSGRFDGMETDMSSETHSDRVGITPSHSHRTSSHTSYSPQPRIAEEVQISAGVAQPTTSIPPSQDSFYHQNMQFNDFGATSGFSSQAPPADNAFTMAPDWDIPQTIPENEWGQVLDSMNWEDANTIPPNLSNWRPMQPSTVSRGQ